MRNKQNQNEQCRGDRFIPSEVRSCAFQLQSQYPLPSSSYEQMLGKSILHQVDTNAKIMNFSGQCRQKPLTKPHLEVKNRHVSTKPFKMLHAPELKDDFYLNLLDWSDNNQIAVGLDNVLELWSGCSSQTTKICEIPRDYICSVSFCDSHRVAIGNGKGQIDVYDINKKKKVNHFDGHCGRVGSLHYATGLLASGSRDGTVASWDFRLGMINNYKAHSQQICGLKWSPEGNYIASGGNDNKLVVYSHKDQKELVRFHQHRAAVKAIGWCPSSPSMLASGGGTADRHIRFFSTQSLSQQYAVDTGTIYPDIGSQICNLVFSKISNEMITTHGYSLNQINLWGTSANWEEKSIKKVTTLTGHTYRVLYLAMSPSGETILTGAGDQTLRFWNVFDSSRYNTHETLSYSMDLR